MKQINIHILLALSLLASLFSFCSDDDSNERTGGDGKITLRIARTLPDVTKADSVAGDDKLNENLIATLDVFIYEEGQ